MEWTVHGERAIYTSDWMSVHFVDVELPDGSRFEYHVVRGAGSAAGVLLHDPDKGVLLIYRHRFIVDRRGWGVPAGGVDAGEAPGDTAPREAPQETGGRVTGELPARC